MVETTQIVLLILFIALSAFFSSVETALFSISRLRISHLLEKKKRGIKTLAAIKAHPRRLLITILIGNNIVNIAASALATTIALDLFQNNAIGITTGIMTLIILIFGEITPKTLATVYNEKIGLLVAKPIQLLMRLLFPIVWIFEKFMKLVINAGGSKQKPVVTEAEIKTFINVGANEGEIKAEEREMIHQIFKFDDMYVDEIMTPKADMEVVEEKQTIEEAVDLSIKTGFSRLPIYRDDMDHFVGFIHAKDALKALRKGNGDKPVKSIMRPIAVIPDSKKLDTLLKQFRSRRQQIALIVDEHGAIRGLITIEDILEELVGEIEDETDKIDPLIQKIGVKKYIVAGKTDVDFLNKKLKLHIDNETWDFDTISGYILHKLDRIPSEGERVRDTEFEVVVKKVAENRIEEVELHILK